MSAIEVIMPKMGESIMEARVLTWLKKPGDYVEADEFILEVATDKIDTEVPSPYAGYLKAILIPEGELAIIGKPICILEASASDQKQQEIPAALSLEDVWKVEASAEPISSADHANASGSSNPWISPLIKQICLQENVTQRELSSIKGTGMDNRITKKDVLTYIAVRNAKHTLSSSTLTQGPGHRLPGDEVLEMDRMRKMIAERMVDSKRISPHVSSFVEADMHQVVTWREKMKEAYKLKFQESLTYTPILIQATAKALRDFMGMNISVEGDYIVQHQQINIGMAVALANGNLIVPIIHEADTYSLFDLSKKVNDLSNRARQNKLKPQDLEGGTFSISNIGSFGNLMGTPIIVQPQVGILAFGIIEKKPAVVSGPAGDVIQIREKMFISHSYDHRVVDGSLGGGFLRRVADYLEQFEGQYLD